MTLFVAFAVHVPRNYLSTTLLLGSAACVLVLFGFKFYAASAAEVTPFDRLVPLGLSYYSLRCVHVLMEYYLERIERPRFGDVFTYLFFPATLVAGPIHRFDRFVATPRFVMRFENVSLGLERILYGYAKIVVLSNYLLSTKLFPAVLSDLDTSSALYQYFDTLEYGITLYLQFSGYSDIAIGFAALLGYRIIENFSWPFLRTNIAQFWRSWHISLTRLSREYVFTGVHAVTRQAWLGIIATMLAISIWHGVTYNYLAWGAYHALGLLIYRMWTGSRWSNATMKLLPHHVSVVVAWFLTFQFVILSFVFTKEDSIAASFNSLKIILTGIFGNV